MWSHPAVWWLYTWLSTNYQEMAIRSGRRSLQELSALTHDSARTLVQEASCSALDSSLEGKLVHMVCPVNYVEPLGESDLLLGGIPSDQRMGIRLETYMEVFQWDEFEYTRKVGKKTERDFLYFREWMTRSPPRNTSFFGDGRECKVKNGGRPCYQWLPEEVEPWWNSSGYELGWDTVDEVQQVAVGDYVIPEEALLTMSIPNSQTLQPSCSEMDNETDTGELHCAPGETAYLLGDTVVWQQMDSNGTMIDYLTRLYVLSSVDTVSILAVQRNNSFVPWPEGFDTPLLFEFTAGSLSASQMIDAASSGGIVSFRLVPWLAVASWLVSFF